MWQSTHNRKNICTLRCHIFLRELFYAMSEPPLRADAKGASPLARTFNFQFLIFNCPFTPYITPPRDSPLPHAMSELVRWHWSQPVR